MTWRCSWNCKHCFFRRWPQLHKPIDTPLDKLKQQINAGKARTCTSVVLCGNGEPMLHPEIGKIIKYISSVRMKSLIITNGSAGVQKYRELYDIGLDHLQVSVHGLGEILNKISERKGVGQKQLRLLEALHKYKLPFRVNTTIQLLNYKSIFKITEKIVQLGTFHVSLLNFLPHYQWTAHMKEVAVNPVDMVAGLEKSMSYMEGKTLFTLRYFPMCLLRPKFWKYVTNAKFVLVDPWEWDYGHAGEDMEVIWKHMCNNGNITGIKGQPCDSCVLRPHCGGWNAIYANAFKREGLKAIKSVPPELEPLISKKGGLFDLNPANRGRAV